MRRAAEHRRTVQQSQIETSLKGCLAHGNWGSQCHDIRGQRGILATALLLQPCVAFRILCALDSHRVSSPQTRQLAVKIIQVIVEARHHADVLHREFGIRLARRVHDLQRVLIDLDLSWLDPVDRVLHFVRQSIAVGAARADHDHHVIALLHTQWVHRQHLRG